MVVAEDNASRDLCHVNQVQMHAVQPRVPAGCNVPHNCQCSIHIIRLRRTPNNGQEPAQKDQIIRKDLDNCLSMINNNYKLQDVMSAYQTIEN